MQKRRANAGFSFVELLVTMVIVLVLYGTLFGPSEAARRRREMAKCAENLRKLHLTMSLYANEHDGAFPARPDARRTEDITRMLMPKYTTDTSFMACPGDGTGYTYIMGLKKADGSKLLVADRLAADRLPIRNEPLFHGQGNHGEAGGNLLFTDGHVEPVRGATKRDLSLPSSVTLLAP